MHLFFLLVNTHWCYNHSEHWSIKPLGKNKCSSYVTYEQDLSHWSLWYPSDWHFLLAAVCCGRKQRLSSCDQRSSSYFNVCSALLSNFTVLHLHRFSEVMKKHKKGLQLKKKSAKGLWTIGALDAMDPLSRLKGSLFIMKSDLCGKH